MFASMVRLALLAGASLAFAFAQASFTGTILGTVTDPTGSVVAGAAVAVTNLGTNEISRVKTDAVGNYFVPHLKLGEYSVAV